MSTNQGTLASWVSLPDEIPTYLDWRKIVFVYVLGFLLFGVGDIVTTYLGLPHPAIHESNEVAWWAMTEFGILTAMLTLKGIWVAFVILLFAVCYKLEQVFDLRDVDHTSDVLFMRATCMTISAFTVIHGALLVINNAVIIAIAYGLI